MAVRTRFAPSPTGYLHIGGARTALYCWLEARRHGGAFILRVEDTDQERSTQAAIDAILEAMQWLGLSYDEGPIYQTQRLDRYREVAEQMVRDGTAYYAYETKEELEAMREAAMAANEKPRYNGAYRDANAGFRDVPNRVIRFKNPDRRHRRVGGQGQGPHRDRQQRARRPGDLPFRRLPDLQLRGRGRRHRHADQRRRAWRRPRQQHAAPDQHLSRARQAGAAFRAPADDPRRAGRQALQAHGRGGRHAVSRRRLPAARAAELSRAPGLVAWRPGNLLDRRNWFRCST